MAGRARRLLPMAMLVVVVTMVASALLLPPLQLRSVWKDGVATAFYGGNYRFAAAQANYLTASGPASPFQQYWSLGVEEQFYLVWPLLLLAVSAAVRPWSRRRPPARAPRASALRRRPPAPSAAPWPPSACLASWPPVLSCSRCG